MGQAAPFIAMAGMQMAGGIAQSKAITASGKAAQMQANFNAKTSEYLAEDALKRGEDDAHSVRRSARRVRGAQRVALAAQGIDLGSGTAEDLQEDTGNMSGWDVLTVKNNAWREAFGYQVQASNYRLEGKIARETARMNARNTLLTSGINAGSSLAKGMK